MWSVLPRGILGVVVLAPVCFSRRPQPPTPVARELVPPPGNRWTLVSQHLHCSSSEDGGRVRARGKLRIGVSQNRSWITLSHVRGETLARFRNQDDRPVRYVLRTSERHKYGNLGRSIEKASLNDPLGQEEVEEARFVRSIAGAVVHVCTSMNPHHDISQ